MPEAPEVETIRKSLLPCLRGKKIGRIRQSKFSLRTRVPTSAFRFLENQTISSIQRHGKMLWVEGDARGGFIVRLGMSGQLLFQSVNTKCAPHTHVVFPLVETPWELRYVDPRRFGEVFPFDAKETLFAQKKRLGPDVLQVLQKRYQTSITKKLSNTSRCIKDVLMDQSVIAGLGNIYACEALFVAELSPLLAAHALSPGQIQALLEAIVQVSREGIAKGGTTFSDFRDGHGRPGQYQNALRVFRREGEACPRCKTAISRFRHNGRSTFLCRVCQSTARHLKKKR